MIRGIITVGRWLKEDEKIVIKKFLETDTRICKKVRVTEGWMLVQLESFSNKIDIMKRNRMINL